MDTLFRRILLHWVPLAVSITAICFMIYLVIQQDIRIGGNDPQIQVAEDIAASLSKGKTLPQTEKINIAESLALFTILYDQKGNVTYSSAELDGKTPELPKSVLSDKKGTIEPGESRISWQPQEGVRLASVVVRYNNGFVLVGRNMREIQNRSDQQFDNILLGWIITLFASLATVSLLQLFLKNK